MTTFIYIDILLQTITRLRSRVKSYNISHSQHTYVLKNRLLLCKKIEQFNRDIFPSDLIACFKYVVANSRCSKIKSCVEHWPYFITTPARIVYITRIYGTYTIFGKFHAPRFILRIRHVGQHVEPPQHTHSTSNNFNQKFGLFFVLCKWCNTVHQVIGRAPLKVERKMKLTKVIGGSN